jgi:hypothetical protein
VHWFDHCQKVTRSISKGSWCIYKE